MDASSRLSAAQPPPPPPPPLPQPPAPQRRRSLPPRNRGTTPAVDAVDARGQKSRQDSSLGSLTKRFSALVQASPGGQIDLKEAAEELGVPKRRLYDITNVLEGIGLISKSSKNCIVWVDPEPTSDGELNHQLDQLHGESSSLDQMIAQVQADLDELREGGHLYLREGIKSAYQEQGQRALAIAAPKKTQLMEGEVPLTLRIQSEKGPIDIYELSPDGGQALEPGSVGAKGNQEGDVLRVDGEHGVSLLNMAFMDLPALPGSSATSASSHPSSTPGSTRQQPLTRVPSSGSRRPPTAADAGASPTKRQRQRRPPVVSVEAALHPPYAGQRKPPAPPYSTVSTPFLPLSGKIVANSSPTKAPVVLSKALGAYPQDIARESPATQSRGASGASQQPSTSHPTTPVNSGRALKMNQWESPSATPEACRFLKLSPLLLSENMQDWLFTSENLAGVNGGVSDWFAEDSVSWTAGMSPVHVKRGGAFTPGDVAKPSPDGELRTIDAWLDSDKAWPEVTCFEPALETAM
eukprot:CAMPEP_0118982168 /NCGR_PEP_ID=MMETSP1173-20130426/32158_1 /TAXON_ID=1034831 /ORGANISM="Rhizochromulina marina cf, Strain CCMP1243" /LENGTH=521 /DNA_ID=CAMNT_0006932637 /DNA_START=21 /DNA_END=1586 /DNA_ORIENTATION=-